MGDLQLASLFHVLRVDLRGAGHTSASPCPVGRQGAPPSRRGAGGGRVLASKPNDVGRGSPLDRYAHERRTGDTKENYMTSQPQHHDNIMEKVNVHQCSQSNVPERSQNKHRRHAKSWHDSWSPHSVPKQPNQRIKCLLLCNFQNSLANFKDTISLADHLQTWRQVNSQQEPNKYALES